MEYGRELHKDSFILPIIAKVKPVKTLKDLMLKSDKLKILGKPDYILITKFNEYVPVEVKWAEEAPKHTVKRDHKLQLTVYALLVDENFHANVKRGYIYYVRSNSIIETFIPNSLKVEVKNIIRKIYNMILNETEPKVKIGKDKCENCGWRMYCKGGLRY